MKTLSISKVSYKRFKGSLVEVCVPEDSQEPEKCTITEIHCVVSEEGKLADTLCKAKRS